MVKTKQPLSPEQILEEIRAWLVTNCAHRPEGITPESEIDMGLNVYGDDADELMDWFFRRFDVHPGAYQAADYFRPEPHLF